MKKMNVSKKICYLLTFTYFKVQHLYDVDKSNQLSKKSKNKLPPMHQGQSFFCHMLTYLCPFTLSSAELVKRHSVVLTS